MTDRVVDNPGFSSNGSNGSEGGHSNRPIENAVWQLQTHFREGNGKRTYKLLPELLGKNGTYPEEPSSLLAQEAAAKSEQAYANLLALESDQPLRGITDEFLFTPEQLSQFRFFDYRGLEALLNKGELVLWMDGNEDYPIQTAEQADQYIASLAAHGGTLSENILRFTKSENNQYIFAFAVRDIKGEQRLQCVGKFRFRLLPRNVSYPVETPLVRAEREQEEARRQDEKVKQLLQELETMFPVSKLPFDEVASPTAEAVHIDEPNAFTQQEYQSPDYFDALPNVPITDEAFYSPAQEESEPNTERVEMMAPIDVDVILDSMSQRENATREEKIHEYAMRVMNERFNRAYDEAWNEADASLSNTERILHAIETAYDRILEQIEAHRQLRTIARASEMQNFWAVPQGLDRFVVRGIEDRLSKMSSEEEQELLDNFLFLEVQAQLRAEAGIALRVSNKKGEKEENAMARSQGISSEVSDLVSSWLKKDSPVRPRFRLAVMKLLLGSPDDPYQLLESKDVVDDKTEQLIRFAYLLRSGDAEQAEAQLAGKITEYHSTILQLLENRKIGEERIHRWIPISRKTEDPAVVEMIALLSDEDQELPVRYLSLSDEQRGFIADQLNMQLNGNDLPREAVEQDSPFSIYKLIEYIADTDGDGKTTQEEIEEFDASFDQRHQKDYRIIQYMEKQEGTEDAVERYKSSLDTQRNQGREQVLENLYRRREQMLQALDTFVDQIRDIAREENQDDDFSTEQVVQIILVCHRLLTDGVYDSKKNAVLQKLRDGLQDLVDEKMPQRKIELPQF